MEAKNSQLSFLVKEDENLIDHYTLKITEDRKKEIKEIQKLMQQVEQLYQKDSGEIPTIHFDKHLYTPLVAYRRDKDFIQTEPPKLNEGETKFVSQLRDYVRNNKDKFQNKDVFLLRNLVRRGMGFFRTSGFYPDFVMWIKDGDKQTISFMDPHGIRNDGNFDEDKIQLHKDIKEIEEEVKKKCPGVKLESSILSVSKYKGL
jgi:hypothetical protein